MLQFQKNAWTERWTELTDTLPAAAGGPIMLMKQTNFTTITKQKTKFSYQHLHLSRMPSSEDINTLKRQNLVFDFYSCVRSTLNFEILLLQ